MMFPPKPIRRPHSRFNSNLTLQVETLEARQMLSTVQIFAAGSTGAEEIQLSIDGNTVATFNDLGTGANAGDFRTLTFNTDELVAADQIRIEFVNDLYDPANGIDRDVRIDAIVVDGARFETEASTVFSTGTFSNADAGIFPGFGRGDTLHTNGYFQFAGESNATEIIVNAAGAEGTESFALQIDGQSVQTFNNISTDFTSYRYIASGPVTADQIRVVFLNDQFDAANGIDSNLIVDDIVVGGEQFETEASNVFSTGTFNAADGIVDGFGRGDTLHVNGFFQYSSEPAIAPAPVLTTVQVFAAGTTGAEEIQLSIDGNVVATYSNLGAGANAGNFQTFTFQTADSVTADQVQIAFVNDLIDANGNDRNVRIDAIAIDGVRFETEASNVFSTGTFLNSDGIAPGFGRGDILHTDGFFQYGGAGEPVVDPPVVNPPVDAPVAGGVIALTGTVTAQQLNEDQFFSVAFDQPLQDAIVVVSPVSFNGGQPVHARVRNVTSTGFEFQFEEWDFLDGSHTGETISWFAVERGVHTLADGAIIEAGSAQVGEQSVDISLVGAFEGAPVVIGQVASENGSDQLVHRLDNVTQSGFDALLQVEEARRGVSFASQDFHYIAFSSGQFNDFATGTFAVDDEVATTSIASGYDGIVLADQQTLNGSDTAGLRITNQTNTSLSLFVEEETSREAELNHAFETVGWVRTNQTISVLGSSNPTPTPDPPSTPDPTTDIAFNLSTSPDRSNPSGLAAATVSGDIFVSIGPADEIDQVLFFLDDTSLSGTPFQTENIAPFDLRGGSGSDANPFDTTELSNGDHTLSVRVLLNDGSVLTQTVTFTVNNQPVTPTPDPEPPVAPPVVDDPVAEGPVTYYVSNSGSDINSDEQAQDRSTPFQTIARALFVARAGDTVIVADGTYNEEIFLENNGTAEADITLRAENEHGARILGFIHGRDVSYITIDGFDITNSNEGAISQGIVFFSSHHITISNNLARDSFGGGISFNQSDSILIEGNTVSGNAFFQPDAHSGISVYQPQVLDDAEGEYGIIIRNNISFENASLVPNQNCCGGNLITDGSGIVLDDFRNSQDGGNGIVYSRRTLVENNLVYDNGGPGIHLFLASSIDIRNNTAVNNLRVLNFGSNINVQNSNDVNVFNNIAVSGSGEDTFLASNRAFDLTFQNNISDGSVNGFNTAGNFLADPGFVNGTFELGANSPAVDAGLSIDDAFSVDVLGQDRIVGQIDIGAVERQR